MREADLTAGSGATVFLHQPARRARLHRRPTRRGSARVGLGSAPVPVAVAERAEALGIGVARAYGSTEHPSTTGSLPDAPRAKRNRTDGRALPGVELRLVDDAGATSPPASPARSGAAAPTSSPATPTPR